MEVRGRDLVIRSCHAPRAGREAAFRQMAARRDDDLIDRVAEPSTGVGRPRMEMVVKRFEVYLVALDPTSGSEIRKTRPCLVVSPDEMNRYISTVIIAPMTTRGQDYPTRIPCTFQTKSGQIVLDQLRTVDKARLVRRLGVIPAPVQGQVLDRLAELFAPWAQGGRRLSSRATASLTNRAGSAMLGRKRRSNEETGCKHPSDCGRASRSAERLKTTVKTQPGPWTFCSDPVSGEGLLLEHRRRMRLDSRPEDP